ncbi:MAG: hypothetical protein ACREJQ_03175 [bacterium]
MTPDEGAGDAPWTQSDTLLRERFCRKTLETGDSRLAQVWMDAAVQNRYRGMADYALGRTNTIGRLTRRNLWTLDFGIASGEALIHASLSELVNILPASERDHWANHVVSLPYSEHFIATRLAPASCIDDGDFRPW